MALNNSSNQTLQILKNKRAFLSVFGGFLVQISLGGVYTYGSMFPYIVDYMQRDMTKGQINNGSETIWILGLTMFGRGASMTLGGFIEHKITATLTILLGGSIMSMGYILTYFTLQMHFILVTITYGLIVGLGTGIAYGVSMTTPSMWFAENCGLLSGIILSGFGIGSLGFDLLQAYYINRDVSNPNLIDPSKVPLSFIIMGCVYFGIQIIGAPMIKKPDDTVKEEGSEVDSGSFKFVNNYKPHQLLFIPNFWIIWITFALNSVVSMLFAFTHKKWGALLNLSDDNLVTATSVGGIFSIVGRILWGYLIDRYHYRIIIGLFTVGMSVVLSTFYLCSNIGDLTILNETPRFAMFLIWVIMLFFLMSSNFSVFPAMCVRAFGPKYYTGNFGLLFTGYSFSALLTSMITINMIKDKNKTEDFLTPFLVGSTISSLSLIVSIFYRNPDKKSLISTLI